MPDYSGQNKDELYAEAQSRGIEGISGMNKDALIATLEADDRGEVPTVDESGEVTDSGAGPATGLGGVNYGGDDDFVATSTTYATDKEGRATGVATTRRLRGKEARKLLDAALDGPPTPEAMRVLAERLPEKDEVQRATKAAMLAPNPQVEAQEKVKVVDLSPDAPDTPSGHALKETAGISSHTERGEEYAREKSAKRWGYARATS